MCNVHSYELKGSNQSMKSNFVCVHFTMLCCYFDMRFDSSTFPSKSNWIEWWDEYHIDIGPRTFFSLVFCSIYYYYHLAFFSHPFSLFCIGTECRKVYCLKRESNLVIFKRLNYTISPLGGEGMRGLTFLFQITDFIK